MTQETIETTVARLDERFRGFQGAFAQMADDQRRMAESYEKLVENNQRVALLEADMVTSKAGQTKLWEKYDALDTAYTASEKQHVEDALKEKNRWIWELAKTAMAIGAAMLLYHLGVHPL